MGVVVVGVRRGGFGMWIPRTGIGGGGRGRGRGGRGGDGLGASVVRHVRNQLFVKVYYVFAV